MLETSTNRISYTGSGTTGPFAFPYYFLEDNDLTVIKVTIATGAESTLTLTTDYTVSGAADPDGGSVTLVAALSSSYKLVILRDPDVLQSTQYPRNDKFPAATHERVVDKLTMLVQRLKDRIDRAFVLSDGDTSGISLSLSGLAASEIIAVNSAGTGLEGKAAADVDLALVSAFVQTLLDDADASAFLTTLGVSAYAKTLLDDADAATARATLGLAIGTNVEAYAASRIQTCWIPAGAMISRTTNGAAAGTVETATNKNMIKTLDFDATTAEYAQFAINMPKSWDEGTITAAFVWSHAATTTNFGVAWELAGVAVSDDDAMDVAFGTAGTVTDTGGTTNDAYITAATSAITIAGTPATNDLVMFQVNRAPANGSDTMAIDARLHGVRLMYTINTLTDA